jgi:hypothetical protein
MILSNLEIIEIKEIMRSYKDLHDSLNLYEKKLEFFLNSERKDPNEVLELGSKIRSCINKLTEERERELRFSQSLEEKYGQGELDIATLEYKTKIF